MGQREDRTLTRFFAISLVVATVATSATRADEGVIAAMDVLRFQAPPQKGRQELAEGKVGRAVRFHFEKDSRGTFFTSNIRGTPEWDRADGFSFWVKGEGEDGL